MSDDRFIGRGWAFPVRADPVTGGIAMVSKDREIQESIRLILSTSYGERPMRPEFGSGLNDFVFAEADATTAGRMAHEVRASLDRWEPRIDVLDVAVRLDPASRCLFYIDIEYAIRSENDARNLVFPFYTIPEEAGSEATAPRSASGGS